MNRKVMKHANEVTESPRGCKKKKKSRKVVKREIVWMTLVYFDDCEWKFVNDQNIYEGHKNKTFPLTQHKK